MRLVRLMVMTSICVAVRCFSRAGSKLVRGGATWGRAVRPLPLMSTTVRHLFMSEGEAASSVHAKAAAAKQETAIRDLMDLDDDGTADGDDLNSAIREPSEGSLRTKVRQHVNPLASKYQQPVALEQDWLQQSFDDPTLPVVIDIGCAKGTWALKYATAYRGQYNVLGLEIRRPIVDLALSRKVRWDLDNVHFLASNANVDLQRVVADLNTQHVPIQMVTIQFPDPYFKKKQHKRRVVNADLVLTLARALAPNSVVFMQSDVQDVQEWMVECFRASDYFDASEGYTAQGIVTNASPCTIQTEREIATANKGMPVYRMLFSRNDKHVQIM